MHITRSQLSIPYLFRPLTQQGVHYLPSFVTHLEQHRNNSSPKHSLDSHRVLKIYSKYVLACLPHSSLQIQTADLHDRKGRHHARHPIQQRFQRPKRQGPDRRRGPGRQRCRTPHERPEATGKGQIRPIRVAAHARSANVVEPSRRDTTGLESGAD